ncbi:hypothetical protein COV18_05545 [Candidatus Woesearchaeota archaeon CG10_big_fil_rev_8_21_14_0_10_37_12]|nr:MAG: hypothetical protein COV18_05545 [Candidatus Woesearchaeota archaeon CG10_big_fil_rev_8_21_14_0_10_37_12]
MTKIAIDVVLLPSAEMTNNAISMNKTLVNQFGEKLKLDETGCLPHISLAMGCVDKTKLCEIKKAMKHVAKAFSPFDLTIEKLNVKIIPTGEKVSELVIKNTKNLQQLHELIMKALWVYFSYDVEIGMLFEPANVKEITLHWIKNYGKHYENQSLFYPHITLGFGELNQRPSKTRFGASELAVFQLGNYCTCKKKLFSINFQ